LKRCIGENEKKRKRTECAAAVWRDEEGAGAGRVAVFGTAAVFEAGRLEHPGNATACDALFGWLRPVRCFVLR